jgi:hypothetical protein
MKNAKRGPFRKRIAEYVKTDAREGVLYGYRRHRGFGEGESQEIE